MTNDTPQAPDHDPVDAARIALHELGSIDEHARQAARARLDAEITDGGSENAPRFARVRSRSRRRWLPASAVAVAGLAVAVFAAVALLPSSDPESGPSTKQGRTMPEGLYLTRSVAGGAFAKINLDEASAADVLHAAGVGATAGIPDGADDAGWAYTRIVQRFGTTVATTERWTSPDAERSFSIVVNDDGTHPPLAWIHYEHLRSGTIGDVTWAKSNGRTRGPRRATWSQEKAGSNPSIERIVRLHDALRSASTADGVRDALRTTLDADELDFRDGMACDGPKGGCESVGNSAHGIDISPEESRTMYENGLLIQALATNVFAPDTTRAMYDFLAAVPGMRTVPAATGDEVALRYRLRSGKQQEYELAKLDAATGRIAEWGSIASRYDAIGYASGPAVGGEGCTAFPSACDELRDLAKRLETDPKAQFEGVVDWMFIAQYCDGLINRDGSTKQGDHMPRSMSKDPKVKAERESCEKREAAAAQAG